MSQACSTLRTRWTASSGPKISSLSTGESAGRSVATSGAQNQPAASGSARARDDPARVAARSRVAPHPLLRLGLDQRRHRGAERVGLADDEHLDRARQALQQRVGDRLVDEHAGRRRALLAAVGERRLDDRRDGLVEVGVGVDDHAVLAAHLGDDALDWCAPGAGLGRRARGCRGRRGPSR